MPVNTINVINTIKLTYYNRERLINGHEFNYYIDKNL